MKQLFFILLSLLSAINVLASNEQCKEKGSSLKVSDSGPYSYAPYLYEIESSEYLFKIDGRKDKFTESLDKESIKRTFLLCSNITVRCFNQNSKIIQAGSVEISFKIQPLKQPKPQDIKISTGGNLSKEVEKCLEKEWSLFEMPEATKQSEAQFAIDFKRIKK